LRAVPRARDDRRGRDVALLLATARAGWGGRRARGAVGWPRTDTVPLEPGRTPRRTRAPVGAAMAGGARAGGRGRGDRRRCRRRGDLAEDLWAQSGAERRLERARGARLGRRWSVHRTPCVWMGLGLLPA